MSAVCSQPLSPSGPPLLRGLQLIMDITPRQKLRSHGPWFLLWLAFEALVVLAVVDRVRVPAAACGCMVLPAVAWVCMHL